jgi:hypothetical protein
MYFIFNQNVIRNGSIVHTIPSSDAITRLSCRSFDTYLEAHFVPLKVWVLLVGMPSEVVEYWKATTMEMS